MIEVIVASVAGALGAVLRLAASTYTQRVTGFRLPVGTRAVNLSGAFALGVVGGRIDLESLATVAMIGLLGGFTTFSTWMLETLHLGPSSMKAALNLTLTLVGGVALAGAGFALSA